MEASSETHRVAALELLTAPAVADPAEAVAVRALEREVLPPRVRDDGERMARRARPKRAYRALCERVRCSQSALRANEAQADEEERAHLRGPSCTSCGTWSRRPSS